MIVGLQKPTSGQVLIDGEDFFAISSEKKKMAMRRRIQMIFQSPYASLNPRWRVRHIIGEPIRAFDLLPASEVDGRVSELLDQVGLAKSDGEKIPTRISPAASASALQSPAPSPPIRSSLSATNQHRRLMSLSRARC